MMIDWSLVRIPCIHFTINGGCVVSYDADGNEEWTTEKRIKAKGTFSSSLSIRSDITSMVEIQGRTVSKSITIDGNFYKFLFGHNVFGNLDLNDQLYAVIQRLVTNKMIEFVCYAHEVKCLNIVKHGGYQVYRLDLNVAFNLGTIDKALGYLDFLGDTSKTRLKGATRKGSSVYWQLGSSHWMLKAYHKHSEITHRSKKHRLNDGFKGDIREFLIEESKPWVRVELQLRSRALKKVVLDKDPFYGDLDHNDKLILPQPTWEELEFSTTLSDLFETFYSKVIRSTTVNIDQSKAITELKAKTYMTFQLWFTGSNPQSILANRTYYTHKKEILEKLDIDISVPHSSVAKYKLTSVTTYELKAVDYEELERRFHQHVQPINTVRIDDYLSKKA